MNELVNLIVKKTKLSPVMAMTVVNIVLAYLKKKLPAPVAAQVTALLSDDAKVKMAANLVGGLASKAKAAKKPAKKGKK